MGDSPVPYFNSRPHKEVDQILLNKFIYIFCISTHDLTRRSTGIQERSGMHTTQISTHDLTRRSTRMSCYVLDALIYFNSRPHKEVDQTQHSAIHSLITFQLTTSQGGRLSRVFSSWVCPHISTHDLTRRSTAICCAFTRADAFQLTTSQGGRPFWTDPETPMTIISTHDLTRRSTIKAIDDYMDSLFQLTTSQGGRLSQSSPIIKSPLFQLTTSQGGRRLLRLKLLLQDNAFQLTTSQGGRLIKVLLF